MSGSHGKDEKYKLPGQVDDNENDQSANPFKKTQMDLSFFSAASLPPTGSDFKTVYAIVPGDSGMVAGQEQLDIEGQLHVDQTNKVLFRIMESGLDAKAICDTERLAFLRAKNEVSGLKLAMHSFSILELRLPAADLKSTPVHFGFKNLISIKGYKNTEKKYLPNKKPTTSKLLEKLKTEVPRYVVIPSQLIKDEDREKFFNHLKSQKLGAINFFEDENAAIKAFMQKGYNFNDATILKVKVVTGDLLRDIVDLTKDDIISMELSDGRVVYDKAISLPFKPPGI